MWVDGRRDGSWGEWWVEDGARGDTADVNATVAVAAITAGSTLCGAALTGGFTLWLHAKQSASQRASAREEARRTAYATFLTAATQAWMALDDIWTLRPPSHLSEQAPAQIATAEAALKDLDHAMHVAVLHGQ